jgi:hypothetical protein
MRLFPFRIGRLMAALGRSRFLAAIEAIAIGLALGLIDVHSKDGDAFDAWTAEFVAGFVLGLRHGGRAWQAWGPLGWCFYLMHRAAIARGYRPPYVEEDAGQAIYSLLVLWPAGVGLALGAFVRFVVSRFYRAIRSTTAGTDQDRSGTGTAETAPDADADRARSRNPAGTSAGRRARQPLAVWEWMVIIAILGINLAALRALVIHDPFLGFGTIYSERYSEGRFQTLRVGMSRGEVEAIMGRPVCVTPWNQETGPHGRERWHYTDQPNDTANFHRRWVYFEDGKVVDIINDFWID